ncbi:DUF676-domain-containing protein [Mycena albidolilacea]|uniref:DUF676-domain-containing protein n=1 Tax=Mycena albidolilacea TaxID=1033008 RepID=A0AAD6ZQC9_9AGAR|nr:DUF676-domain-containing protein [Mycena albidolilacea]
MHLHLLIHGLQGHPRHLGEAARLFSARHPAVHLVIPNSFTYDHTYDGIDWNAARILLELDEAIAMLEKDPLVRVTRLSITGYSMGGLYARYLIGMLYSRGFFESVEAVNFTSFTTPHAGIPPHPHTSRVLFWIGSTVFGRSGKQLHLRDNWADTGYPLLQAIAHPDFAFYHGLSKFRKINIYANAINDFTVPYFSGAFEEADPFAEHPERDIIPEHLPDYTPLIQGFSLAKSSPSLGARLKSLPPLTFNGPFVAWAFPWNIIVYLLLPMLVPIGVVYITIDCLLSSRSSRARVRILEKNAPISIPVPPPSNADAPLVLNPDMTTLMTAQQAMIVHGLNRLDGVHKYTAFRPRVRNSHAMLICLEPRFADHRAGRGVLRHWVDNFEV